MTFDPKALAPTWIEGYNVRRIFADLLAGLILSVLLLPQAMAYAQLAGLPPETGLYAALAPPLLYLVFGTSPYVSLGPVALVSLLIAEATGSGDIDALQGAMIIAIEAGVILCLLGILRLGRLVNFVSEPALLGFTAAAAVLIATSQLPSLLGLDVARSGNLVGTASVILPALGDTMLATLLIGGGALALLLIADRYAAAGLWKIGIRPPWRQAIVKSVPLVVIVAVAAVVQFAAPDVSTVPRTEGGLPDLALSPLDPAIWLRLLPSSAVVAIIAFVVGTAVAKSLAGQERRSLNTSREAFAIGAATSARVYRAAMRSASV
ncbi:MAG: SulP family inorganic anion transporter [Pseudomonadota bacterium]